MSVQLPRSRARLCWLLAAALLLAAPAAATAQDCSTHNPPCPVDEPPTLRIFPTEGTVASEEMEVLFDMIDDSKLDDTTFVFTISGATTILSHPYTATHPAGSAARARTEIRLQAGVPAVINARICDALRKCVEATATYTYVPPPPPPPRARPVLLLEPHNQDLRVPSAFEVRAGYATPAYVSLDAPRSVALAYSSELASPTAFIQVDALPNSSVLPEKVSISVRDGVGRPVRFTNGATENFYRSGAGATRLAAQWDASTLPTGAYSYTVVVRNWWGAEFLEVREAVRVLVVNERESRYGAGWTVAGLQRLHTQHDGSMVLAGGNGSAAYFALQSCDAAGCRYKSPPGDFSVLTRSTARDAAGTVTSDEYRLRLLDGTVATYRADGRITSLEDRFGNRSHLDYGTDGRLTAVTDPIGKRIELGYDAAGKLSWIRDPGPRTANVRIDRAGDLIRIYDPDGVTAFQGHYGERHLLGQVWDRTGAGTGFTYDAAGKLARQLLPGVVTDSGPVRPDVRIRSWEVAQLPARDSGTFVTPATRAIPSELDAVVTDPRGTRTYTRFDRWGQPTRVLAGEQASTWVRNGAGQLIEFESSAGAWSRYEWSGPDLVAVRDLKAGTVTTLAYDERFHQPDSVWVDDELRAESFYGALGQLDSTRVGASVTRYAYDARGRGLSVTDPEGHASEAEYEPAGMQNTKAVRVQGVGAARETSFAYDSLGRLRSTTDPGGRVAGTEYDLLNRPTRVTGPDSTEVRYGYDDRARRYTVTDSRGQTYTTVANALGWTESLTDPRGKAERFVYSRNGNVMRYTNRRGQDVTFAYDSLDRVLTRTADGQTTTYGYDPKERWIAVANEESTDTVRTDYAGRPSQAETFRDGVRYALTFSLTKRGGRRELTSEGPWGTRKITTAGEALSQMNYLATFGEPRGTGFEYNADRLVEGIHLPTQTTTDTTRLRMSFGYTPLHSTSRIGFNIFGVEHRLGRTYGYDALERVEKIVQTNPAPLPETSTETRTLAYDSVGRLEAWHDVMRWTTSELVCEGAVTVCTRVTTVHEDTLRSDRYTYDRVGNRTDRGSVVENGNRLTSFDGYTLQYDDDGNLVRKFRLNAAGAVTFDQTLSWNTLGQLESVTRNGVTTAFGYDGFGRRVRKTSNVGTTRYVWDGDDLALELDGAGNLLREYAYYPGVDRPHSVRRVSDGAVFRYTQEVPGHVSGLVAAGNQVVNTYTYTPFGEPLNTNEQVNQPLRYAAREYDEETGLYYVRARYYDPQQGRFVSEDPIGLAGGINPYAYVRNDPVNLTDPAGLDYDEEVAAGGFAARGLSSACTKAVEHTSYAE